MAAAPASCRSCRAPIVWAMPEGGKKAMPIDCWPDTGTLRSYDDGNVAVVGEVEGRYGEPMPSVRVLGRGADVPLPGPRYKSHFATCPNAKEHRRG